MIQISSELSSTSSLLASNSGNSLFDTMTELKSSLFHMHPSGSQYFSIYDTAFLSLVQDSRNRPIFSNSLKILFSSLNKDGSWGNRQIFSDNLLCTFASVHALQQSHLSETPVVQKILTHAENFIYDNYNRIAMESFFTAGFEFIVPNLISKTGLDLLDHPITKKLMSYQKKKLSKIPLEYIQQQKTPMLFALESLDTYDIQQNLDHFVEANGSIATSPSTTAWYLAYNPDSDKIPEMVRYLTDQYNPHNGSVPSFADYSLMNIPFVLYPLLKANIPFPTVTTLLEYVKENWTKTGIGHSTYFPMTDADDTALGLLLLRKFNVIDGDSNLYNSLLAYKRDGYYVTYPWEIGASNMVNLHVLDMLLESKASLKTDDFGLDELLSFISNQITPENGIGGDKYHYSPYCQNCHGVLTLSTEYPDLSRQLIDWFIRNQDSNGLWGVNGPTVEETAYAVMSLCYYHIHAVRIDLSILNKAIDYLLSEQEPYQNLWLSKVAYTPIETVQAHILAALELYHQALT